MDIVTLKPCPFCGGEAHTVEPARYGNQWGVSCVNYAHCKAFQGFYTTENEAIEAWNTRAERMCICTTDDSAWCFVCSECGKSFPRNKLHLAHNHGEINYCPNCGAKVVD